MDGALFVVNHSFEEIPHNRFLPDRGALSHDRNIPINERTFSFRNFSCSGKLCSYAQARSFGKTQYVLRTFTHRHPYS
jgi:hypothetical protein